LFFHVHRSLALYLLSVSSSCLSSLENDLSSLRKVEKTSEYAGVIEMLVAENRVCIDAHRNLSPGQRQITNNQIQAMAAGLPAGDGR
jgi:hypothetical protein